VSPADLRWARNDGSWKIVLFEVESPDLVSNLAKRKG
jgi:hypothetical protein